MQYTKEPVNDSFRSFFQRCRIRQSLNQEYYDKVTEQLLLKIKKLATIK